MTVSELQHNINEQIFSSRDRLILTLKYVDGLTYDEIANLPYENDEYKIINIDVRQIRRICRKYESKIFK